MNQDICSICLELFSIDDDIKKLKCNHIFNKSCIDNWFKSSNRCPICKNIEFKIIDKVYRNKLLYKILLRLLFILIISSIIFTNSIIFKLVKNEKKINKLHLFYLFITRFLSIIIRDLLILNIINKVISIIQLYYIIFYKKLIVYTINILLALIFIYYYHNDNIYFIESIIN